MLNTAILNQMDVDELRNYIHKQDVAMDYYKIAMRTYDAELRHLEAFISARSERFNNALSLNAAKAVITDIEYELEQKYRNIPCEDKHE